MPFRPPPHAANIVGPPTGISQLAWIILALRVNRVPDIFENSFDSCIVELDPQIIFRMSGSQDSNGDWAFGRNANREQRDQCGTRNSVVRSLGSDQAFR